QLNRASLQRQRPGLADLRESGAIEQDADQVWLLHMDPEEGGNAVDVIVAKNRNGQVGGGKLFRQGHYSRMLPPAPREGRTGGDPGSPLPGVAKSTVVPR